MSGVISIDTETTGVDVYHGARPFFVTIYAEGAKHPLFWEWEVDPFTREVAIPEEDAIAIAEIIEGAETIVGQNIKFDIAMLREAGIVRDWPWHKTHCSLLAGHLLYSGLSHNLTDMVLQYLGHDIQPLEKDLEKAVKKARDLGKALGWAIAKKDRPDMPSAKETVWKYDAWLPRQLAEAQEYDESHEWRTVTQKYGNEDSVSTLFLWQAQEKMLKEANLWPLYEEKRVNLRSCVIMEENGVAVLGHELRSLKKEYAEEKDTLSSICVNIAESYGYQLDLPKGASPNNSLRDFCFGPLDLPRRYSAKAKSDNPTLDKDTLTEYELTLPARSKALLFIKSLKASRKRATALSFIESYESYWLPIVDDYMLLHQSVNPTGTGTTRFSMSNPNLQQVGKQETECQNCEGEGCEECDFSGEDLHSIRRVFGPAPGREWYSMDAENIELRIPAYESGEPDLIALFEKPNDPPFYGSQHLLNMSIVFDDVWQSELQAVGLEKVGPHCKKKYASSFYQNTKNGDFAIQYQCGEETADRTFKRPGAFRKLKAKFKKQEALNQWCVRFAEKHGYIETIVDKDSGCERGYPLMCARGEGNRIKPTVPFNYRTQGTAGRWMVRAMNKCQVKLDEWRLTGFDGHMCLTVHDELVFDFPRCERSLEEQREAMRQGIYLHGDTLWRAAILRGLMQSCGRGISIPTPVSMERHLTSWAEGETCKREDIIEP